MPFVFHFRSVSFVGFCLFLLDRIILLFEKHVEFKKNTEQKHNDTFPGLYFVVHSEKK